MTSSSLDEYQQLQAERSRIDARLAELSNEQHRLQLTAHNPAIISHNGPSNRSGNLQHASSLGDPSYTAPQVGEYMPGPPMKRAKTVIQPQRQRAFSSQMARSSSSRSARSNPTPVIPFTGSGPITPPCLDPASQQLAMDQAFDNTNQAAMLSETPYSSSAPASTRPARRSLPPLQTLAESSHPELEDVGMDVGDFLASRDNGLLASSFDSPHFTTPQYHPTGFEAYHHAQHAPPLPSFVSTPGSLTDGQSFSTPLSRQSSSAFQDNMSISGTVEMLRLSSQTSSHGASPMATVAASSLGKRALQSEQDFLGIGSSIPDLPAYPMSTSSTLLTQPLAFQHNLPGHNPANTLTGEYGRDSILENTGADFLDVHLSMERSTSNTSIKSTSSSLNLRAKEALHRVLKNATKAPMLQPKPVVAEPVVVREPTPPPPEKEAKKEISAPKYQRPRRPRVSCDQCDKHPEGFRGEHELRRHILAKHRGTVKKFICREPVAAGLETTIEAIRPLSKCKACISQKKYGAYYNAAEHLRRVHFKERPMRKGPGSSSQEKRGGKGGGNWPPMSELKKWFYEAEVPIGPNDSDEDEDDDVDEAAIDDSIVDPPESFEDTAYTHVHDPFTFDHLGSHLSPHDRLGEHHHLSSFGLPDLSHTGPHALHVPLSSAGFFEPQNHHLGQYLNGGGAEYASPVESSCATITQANMYGGQDSLSAAPAPANLQGDFDFNSVFDPTGTSF